jgi:hypothetical protein
VSGHRTETSTCSARTVRPRPTLSRSPSVPPSRGRVGGREPGTPRTDAPPTANPTHGKEVNHMRRPSLEELQRQVEEEGGCAATDGCFVEPDGYCEHQQPSWLLALGLL